MLQKFIFHHLRHNDATCHCIADEFKKSYREEDNNGVKWCALQRTLKAVLYEPIRPRIIELSNEGLNPQQIADQMTEEYQLPYKWVQQSYSKTCLDANTSCLH